MLQGCRVLVLMCLLLSFAGCTQYRTYNLGVPLQESEMPTPEQGWTMSQVLDKLGPPLRLSAEANGWGLFNIFPVPALLAVILSVAIMDFAIYLQHVLVRRAGQLPTGAVRLCALRRPCQRWERFGGPRGN